MNILVLAQTLRWTRGSIDQDPNSRHHIGFDLLGHYVASASGSFRERRASSVRHYLCSDSDLPFVTIGRRFPVNQ
jgi:hypothetical protein